MALKQCLDYQVGKLWDIQKLQQNNKTNNNSNFINDEQYPAVMYLLSLLPCKQNCTQRKRKGCLNTDICKLQKKKSNFSIYKVFVMEKRKSRLKQTKMMAPSRMIQNNTNYPNYMWEYAPTRNISFYITKANVLGPKSCRRKLSKYVLIPVQALNVFIVDLCADLNKDNYSCNAWVLNMNAWSNLSFHIPFNSFSSFGCVHRERAAEGQQICVFQREFGAFFQLLILKPLIQQVSSLLKCLWARH